MDAAGQGAGPPEAVPQREQRAPSAARAADAAPAGGGDAGASGGAGGDPGPEPLPYVVGDDGAKRPLPGAFSIFLRGATAAAMGLATLRPPQGSAPTDDAPHGAAAVPPPLFVQLPRERVLADIQLQGAISDFHPIRDAARAADCDPLLVRGNEDDAYGDGGNYEVACTRAACDAWQAAEEWRRAAAEAAAVAAAGAAAQAAQPKSKRRRPPQPWVDLGSEAELSEVAGPPPAPPARLILERPLRDFVAGRQRRAAEAAAAAAPPAVQQEDAAQQQQGVDAAAAAAPPPPARRLVDVAASDLWNSATSECRPFKDGNYDLRRARREAGAQAVPVLAEAGVQATGGRAVPGSTQYSPRDLSAGAKQAAEGSPLFATFLEGARARCEEALLQNAVADVAADDLAALQDDDDAGAADAGGVGAARGAAAVVEVQSFTDLVYSRNKVASCVRWVAGRRGVVAVAVTDPASHQERLARAGRLEDAYILIWNFRDPIHPECVLECPHEVVTFEVNPVNTDIIAGGCHNGQVVVWDLSDARDRTATRGSAPAAAATGGAGAAAAPRGLAAGGGGDGGGGAVGGGAGDTPVVRHRFMSAVEASHSAPVADLQWLPGIEVDRSGRAFPVRAGSAGTSHQSLARSSTLGAAALAALQSGSSVPRECCFCATLGPDGRVMLWDCRADQQAKRGGRRPEGGEAAWRPMHVVHLLNMHGVDFAGSRLAFDFRDLTAGSFLAGSLDGQLLGGTFVRAAEGENPEYTRFCHAPHAGPIVALARSPFIEGLVASVGDCCFKLWLGDAPTPLFESPFANEVYTAACWSPTRPGLLLLGDAAGGLHAWDLLDRTHEPALHSNAASAAVASLAFSGAPPPAAPALAALAPGGGGAHGAGGAAAAAGQVLALGDAAGVLHLMALPRTLRRPLPGEARLMGAFVRREGARVAEVAARQPARAAALKEYEEARKERAAAAAAAADRGAGPAAAAAAAGGRDAGGGRAAAAAARRRSSAGSLGAARGGGVAAGAWDAAALEKAEAEYLRLEAEFKSAIGLAA
ncbi:MAG: inner dynein arm I1 intermediate chain [Monoraphidium minutum]|nr:MAG: inner dynein arm I1 intermediate chain [Monoraphidium minutum]